MGYSTTIPTDTRFLLFFLHISRALLRGHYIILATSLVTTVLAIIVRINIDKAMSSPLFTIAMLMWVLSISSFAHESAHAFILAGSTTVDAIHVESLPWRTSVSAQGSCSRLRLTITAIAGPFTGLATCAIAWAIHPHFFLWLVSIPHLLALTPFSGDGRALITVIKDCRHTQRTKHITRYKPQITSKDTSAAPPNKN